MQKMEYARRIPGLEADERMEALTQTLEELADDAKKWDDDMARLQEQAQGNLAAATEAREARDTALIARQEAQARAREAATCSSPRAKGRGRRGRRCKVNASG